MDSLVVVGDTASDMQAGERAGAGLLVVVLSGNDDEERLRANGADEGFDSVAELLAVLEEPEDSSV